MWPYVVNFSGTFPRRYVKGNTSVGKLIGEYCVNFEYFHYGISALYTAFDGRKSLHVQLLVLYSLSSHHHIEIE